MEENIKSTQELKAAALALLATCKQYQPRFDRIMDEIRGIRNETHEICEETRRICIENQQILRNPFGSEEENGER